MNEQAFFLHISFHFNSLSPFFPQRMSRAKIAFFGDPHVGQTFLIHRINGVDLSYTCYEPTDCDDTFSATIDANGKQYLLEMYHSWKLDEYSALRDQFVRTCHAFGIIYSITSRVSFEHVSEYISFISRERGDKNVPTILVGNKCDLEEERQVPTEEAMEFSKSHGMQFFEVSAKTYNNVDLLIKSLVELCESSLSLKNNTNPESSSRKEGDRCFIQ